MDLIHDTRHLCTRSRIDGIKTMSRGISGIKQMIKLRVIAVDWSKLHDDLIVMQNVHFEFRLACENIRFSSLLAAGDARMKRRKRLDKIYVTLLYCENIHGCYWTTSTHILPLSSLRWQVFHFLLSRVNKLALVNTLTCFPPEKERDIAFISSVN